MTSAPPSHDEHTSDARAERGALADLLLRLGPDAPTLCEGWDTRDLAGHLVMRERRPDAAAGIVVPPLKGWSERVRTHLAAEDYPGLVAKVRTPPWWSMSAIGPLDQAVNTLEYFVHHEDVRRAQPGWKPRVLAPSLAASLWKRVQAMARLNLRKFPASVVIAAPGLGEVHGGRGGAPMRITGDPGELAMFFMGRQRATHVDIEGPADLADGLRHAKFGV